MKQMLTFRLNKWMLDVFLLYLWCHVCSKCYKVHLHFFDWLVIKHYFSIKTDRKWSLTLTKFWILAPSITEFNPPGLDLSKLLNVDQGRVWDQFMWLAERFQEHMKLKSCLMFWFSYMWTFFIPVCLYPWNIDRNSFPPPAQTNSAPLS